MKLIDLLVQELPSCGSWPQGSQFIAADMDGRIDSYENEPELDNSKESWRDSVVGGYEVADIIPSTEVSDWQTSIISREEYEAALAASKQVEWDGEGFPPVGIDCEYLSNGTSWGKVKIIGREGDNVIFVPLADLYYAPIWESKSVFQPLKTEAEQLREAAIASLQESLKGSGYGLPDSAAKIVVDAIAQGKVSGLKLID